MKTCGSRKVDRVGSIKKTNCTMRHYMLIGIFLSLIVSSTFAQHEHHGATDQPTTHGMLIMGKEIFYLSHLPMFGGAHNYQGIFRVKLDEKSAKVFKKDQANHPENPTYSIAPIDTFVLPEMAANPRPFKAELYRGHFERGGELISQSVTITIEKVVLFKKFDLTKARDTKAEYIIFGSNKEKFIAHLISNRPDFEQIIQVKTSLEEGIKVVLNNDSNNVVGVSGNTVDFGKNKPTITLLKQVYLEFGDLE
jgi:hypothetical protein